MTAPAERARAALVAAQPILHQLQLAESVSAGTLPAGTARRAWDTIAQVLGPLAPSVVLDNDAIVPASPLVSALRAQGVCTLDEAHALVDLHALASRDSADAHATGMSGDLPRELIARATTALHRIVQTASASANSAPLSAEYARAASPPPAGAPSGSNVPPSAPPTAPPTAPPSAGSPQSATVAMPASPTETAGGARSSRFVVLFVVVCLVAGGIAAALLTGVGRTSAYARGVTAYEAGQRVVARIAFEDAMADDPTDPMPLVYLGRLSREEGDLPQARKLLEQAVQRAPDNALTHRELASALLADGEFELARRFYVRALTIDPTDRPAQGFLGCALSRLGRADEATRWLDRAGPGDWTACAATRTAP